MGSSVGKQKSHNGNKVASSVEIQVNDLSVELDKIEEIKIPDKRTRHKNQKSKSLLNFVGKGKSFTSFRKTKSLVVVEEESEKIIISDYEQLRKYYDQLQMEHKSALVNFEQERKNNEEKMNRLKNEVKVLNAALPKLIADKEKARAAEQDALERARAFEQEKDRIQRQFNVFRETKEKEIQAYLHDKQRLWNELRKLNPDNNLQEVFNIDDESLLKQSNINTWLLDNVSLPPESCIGRKTGSVYSVNAELMDLKTNKDIAIALQDLLSTLHHKGLGVPTSNQFHVYVTSTDEMQDAALALTKSCKPLVDIFEMEGKHLCCCYYPLIPKDPRKTSSTLAYLQSSAVVVILCSKLSNDVQSFMNNAVQSDQICFVAGTAIDTGDGFVTSIESNRKLHIVTSNGKQKELIEACRKDISDICYMFISKQQDQRCCEVGLLRNFPEESVLCANFDVQYDIVQKSFQRTILSNLTFHDSMEEKLQYLNSYITQDGPQQPLLVTSPPGGGKSSLLAAWVIELQESLENSCILYHVVSSMCPSSADPVKITRRFIWLLLDQLPTSCEGSKLEKEFPFRLERACTQHSNGVIIIIDGAEKIAQNDEYFQWLLDPLPVPVRVVVSVTTGSKYPNKWTSWPKFELTIDPLISGLESFLSHLDDSKQNDCKMILQNISPQSVHHVNNFNSNLTANYLFNKLCTIIVNYLTPTEKMKRVLLKCVQVGSIVELYTLILKLLLKKFEDALVMEILVLISLSYTGLTLVELHELTDRDIIGIYEIVNDLYACHVLVNISGLILLSRSEVKEAVEMFKVSSSTDKDLQSRTRIIEIFMEKFQKNHISQRVIEELPWQLSNTGKVDDLLKCLKSSRVFCELYRSCNLSLISYYWNILHYDITSMHELYMKSNYSYQDFDFYDILGQFVEDKSLYKLAQSSYSKSLELKELQLDADDVRIVKSFLNLARLFTQWKKYQTAEDYYKLAMSNQDPNSILYAKILESLAIFYSLQGNLKDFDIYVRQACGIRHQLLGKKMKETFESTANECRVMIERLQQENYSSEELVKYFTSAGLIYYNIKMYKEASQLLNNALVFLKSIFYDDHPDIADVLCKVGFVYKVMQNYEESELVLKQGFSIYCKTCPIDSPEVQNTLKSLVSVLVKQKKWQDVEELYVNVIQLEESALGNDHILVGQCVTALAVHLSKMQRLDDALNLYKHALSIYNEQVGFQHDLVSELLKNMAKLYYDQNEPTIAAQVYALSFESDRKIEQLTIS